MSSSEQNSTGEAAPGRALLPPYLVVRDFLEENSVSDLLDYALSHEQAFQPTKVGRLLETKPNTAIRVSHAIRDLGKFRPILESKILSLVPGLVAKFGTTAIESPRLELELVAHNDGAFYTRHIDTRTASERKHIRVLSGVYYFHSKPKAFTGGALRLYAIGDPAGRSFVDIEPAYNALLVFPSWAPHEVLPVRCPSKEFLHSRFAVNCWVHRIRPEAA